MAVLYVLGAIVQTELIKYRKPQMRTFAYILILSEVYMVFETIFLSWLFSVQVTLNKYYMQMVYIFDMSII